MTLLAKLQAASQELVLFCLNTESTNSEEVLNRIAFGFFWKPSRVRSRGRGIKLKLGIWTWREFAWQEFKYLISFGSCLPLRPNIGGSESVAFVVNLAPMEDSRCGWHVFAAEACPVRYFLHRMYKYFCFSPLCAFDGCLNRYLMRRSRMFEKKFVEGIIWDCVKGS
jgi:hypothetical protein